MAVLTSKLIVSLVDQVTAPLRAINASLKSVQDGIRANNAAMDAMRGRVIEAGAVAYGLARAVASPVAAASDFETTMIDIGQKADLGTEAIQALGKRVRSLARDLKTSSGSVAGGIDTLMGMGAGDSDALELISPITKAARAYRAEVADLSKAGYSALDNLKVPAAQFSQALDAMAQAGKDGAFELRDMAQYFPTLGAAYQGLKQSGVPAVADLAAALQVVRKGTGDSSSAATNLANLLQKISSPGTIRNFSKLGINLRAELEKAAQAGRTPIEAISDLVNKTLAGDLSRMGELFEDAQVQAALRPLIQNMEEYRAIRERSLSANGVVDADYEQRMASSTSRMEAFRAGLENIGISIGNTLLPALNDVLDTIAPLLRAVEDFNEANPALVRGIVLASAGLVAFRVAATAAAWGGLFLKGGILQIASIGLQAARGLLMILNPVRLLTGAMGLLRVAMVGTGIGAILVAIGLAGAFIYNNWDGLSAAFSAFGDAFMAALGPAKPLVDSVISGFSELWSWVSSLVGPLDASQAQWANWGAGIGTTLGAIAADLPGAFAAIDWSGLWSQVSASLTTAITSWTTLIGSVDWNGVGQLIGRTIGDGLAGLLDIGTMLHRSIMSGEVSAGGLGSAIVNLIVTQVTSAWSLVSGVITGLFGNINLQEAAVRMMETLWEGVKSMASKIAEYLQSVLSSAISSIGSQARSLLSSITFGLAGSSDPAPVDGARASGGPVWGGGRFLVGEQGPELFSPSRSGFIIPAAATRALALASSLGAAAAPAHAINFDAYTLPEDVERAMMQPRAPGGGATAAQAPARNVNISPTIHITMSVTGVNDPDAIARELGRRVTERLEGALMDIDTGV